MIMTKLILGILLLGSTMTFAQIHNDCHSDNHDSRLFAVGYAGAVIDLKTDKTVNGHPVYQMPSLNYEQAFGEVCKVIDQHPELWNRPSRDAIILAVDILWKRKD
jgi:hypothetical protein